MATALPDSHRVALAQRSKPALISRSVPGVTEVHCAGDRPASVAVARVTATPKYHWRGGLVRRATIEIDRETKAVRRLVIERELPQQGSSTVTFTLVESRRAEESKYRPEGHLTEPFRLLTRDSQPDNRRELLTNRCGPAAERWIVDVPRADEVHNLAPESEQALRSRVSQLFESLRSGDADTCVSLTDPQVVETKGRAAVRKYFQAISRLVRASRVTTSDRIISRIVLIDDGGRARVDIEATLNGVKHPPGFEIWSLQDGQWFYQETPR